MASTDKYSDQYYNKSIDPLSQESVSVHIKANKNPNLQ
jgi:hypothetical protein